jgi:hypothetical protein
MDDLEFKVVRLNALILKGLDGLDDLDSSYSFSMKRNKRRVSACGQRVAIWKRRGRGKRVGTR